MEDKAAPKITLEMHLLSGYPSTNPPIPKLVAPSWALDEGRKADILKELNAMIIPGTEMAILWSEHCRAELHGEGDDGDVGDGDNSEDIKNELSTVSASSAAAQHQLIAVIEFHHMLIGNMHKKESQTISAASANGIQGYIYMGGPSLAIVKSTNKEDTLNWLHECKKSGKPGDVGFWKSMSSEDICRHTEWPSKLKIVGYATGKGEKPDMESYKQMLSQLSIPYPLPSTCPDLTLD